MIARVKLKPLHGSTLHVEDSQKDPEDPETTVVTDVVFETGPLVI